MPADSTAAPSEPTLADLPEAELSALATHHGTPDVRNSAFAELCRRDDSRRGRIPAAQLLVDSDCKVQRDPERDAAVDAIAAKFLRVETLETRSDYRLDFHTCAVWGLAAALEAAFEAGKKAANSPPAAKPGYVGGHARGPG